MFRTRNGCCANFASVFRQIFSPEFIRIFCKMPASPVIGIPPCPCPDRSGGSLGPNNIFFFEKKYLYSIWIQFINYFIFGLVKPEKNY